MNNKIEELFNILSEKNKYLERISFNSLQGEYGVLSYLAFINNKVAQTELKDYLKVTKPRVVSIINSLENKNLIKKEQDENDKRKTIIAITQKGIETIKKKKNECLKLIETVANNITNEELEQYIGINAKIVDILKKNEG